jgi:hypothetical protein
MAGLLPLFHLGLLASKSIPDAVSIKASRVIIEAEDDWQIFWSSSRAQIRSLAILMVVCRYFR